MGDRFKDDTNLEDFTFYSMSKKKEKKNMELKYSTGKWLYCCKCGSSPIIKVDNAKEYICDICFKEYLKGKAKWKL